MSPFGDTRTRIAEGKIMKQGHNARMDSPGTDQARALPRSRKHGGIWKPSTREPLEHWLERIGAASATPTEGSPDTMVVMITRPTAGVGRMGILSFAMEGRADNGGSVGLFRIVADDWEALQAAVAGHA